ncbi:extensin family protein [Ancylobacter oerskovii]|uniref:Extensin family protein n=1 Tax=Ancylobacter oerskovii TaxID=459519 RepID=A0ABW4YTI5_9HYPH|nr:extensin family protein [Ancylobacter oerskovii]MBS7543360.1 extensin family protein [Ancylobacter oerskovii]
MIIGLALALMANPPPARAQQLKSDIDRAGTAASRQIEQWLGAPAPARKTRPKAAAARARARAADPSPARSVPLPPPRPADLDAAGPATPSPEMAAAAAARPAARTSTPPPFTARPAQPAGPVAPVEEEPAFAEAPGIPLPPLRPDRATAAAVALGTTARTAAGPVPLPPPRPRLAALAAPGEDAPPPSTASNAAAADEAADEPAAEATGVPLPPARPSTQTAMLPPGDAPVDAPLTPPPGPLAGCPELSVGEIGTFTAAAVKMSPACRIERPVSLTGVKLKDGRLVPLEPAATLRCDMAAAVARWVREGVAPAVETLGSPLATIQVADSYSCRPRNRVRGAKISEHGQGNAMDTRGYTLMDGRSVLVGGTGEQAMPLAFQERLKASACADFTTILGPGSDGYHELHLHVDRAVRRSNMVLCRWATGTRPPGARAGTAAPSPAPAARGAGTAGAKGAAAPSPAQTAEPAKDGAGEPEADAPDAAPEAPEASEAGAAGRSAPGSRK